MTVFSKASTLHQIKFGTDGWRALIAKEFTYENLQLCVDGLALYIIKNYQIGTPILIGYDARFLADNFARFAAENFNKWGIPVLLIDHPVPTPTIAFAAQSENSCGALTFTASHNPPEYMGIKYIPEYGGPASVKITDQIVDFINERAESLQSRGRDKTYYSVSWDFQAETKTLNPKEAYFTALRKIINFDLLKKLNQEKVLKVIYDPLYGVGRNYTNSLLKEAGFDVETLHDKRDPLFGGTMPDPSEALLGELKSKVLETKASFGAANDGDADRFAYIGEDGNFFPANKAMPIILKYLIENRGFRGTVARTIATTHLLDEIAKKHGQKFVETTVGFKWLCEVMRSEDTIIACEESGGMSLLGHIPEKDGILAVLVMAEVLAATGKTLSELWQEVQDFVGKKYFYNRLDLHFDGDLKDRFVEFFRKDGLSELAGFKVIKRDLREGAKIYLENGSWLLARPSGTEAMCRVYFEGNNQSELDHLVSEIKALVSKL
jgi:phosphomannomutase